MSKQDIVEVYRAKSWFQAHVFVMELERAGIAAQNHGGTFHPGAQTAANAITGIAVSWDAPRILVSEDDAPKLNVSEFFYVIWPS